MIFPYLGVPFTTVNLYQRPVHPGWGARKFTALCCAILKRQPDINELFLFYTRARETLRLFWRDINGTQEITRFLAGGFLLPAPKPDQAFVQLDRKMLDRLFRVPKQAPGRPQVRSASADFPSEIDGQKRLQETGFIEIDPSQLHALLNPIRRAPPMRAARPKNRKASRKILRFRRSKRTK